MTNASTGNISANILATRLDPLSYPYIIVLILLVIIGGTGNALVILSPIVEKRLRTPHHSFIVYLAVIDFTVCCFVVVSSIVSQIRGFVTPLLCGVSLHLTPFLSLFSLHLQCLIGFSRYKQICSPIRQRLDVFKWKVSIASSITCLLADMILYGMSTLLSSYSVRIRIQRSVGLCFLVASGWIIRKLTFFAVLVILPVVIVVILYCKLFSYIKANSISLALQQRRQARMSLVLFRLFFAWFLGYVILTVVSFIDDEAEWPGEIYKISYFFFWLNSCINPILYGFKAKELASVFKKILFCGKIRSSSVVPSGAIEMTPVISILGQHREPSQQ